MQTYAEVSTFTQDLGFSVQKTVVSNPFFFFKQLINTYREIQIN